MIHSGNLTLTDGNKKYYLKSGDVIDLKKSSYHKFQAGKEGCIFEEISTTSFKSDSYYESQKIKKMSLAPSTYTENLVKSMFI